MHSISVFLMCPRLLLMKLCTSILKSDYTEKGATSNVHDSCTVSMCNVKMRKDLIKGTNYTTKRITIRTKSHQDDDQMLLIIIILMFGQKMTALNKT